MPGAAKPLILVEGLHYTYQAGTRKPIPALRGIDLSIDAGEYVAVVGANGSGKSTLLRHLNALLLPTSGTVRVAGWDTHDPAHLRDVRSTVGMVFQVPDTQIVATIVEEDVAFGPENLGVPEDELRRRVDWALSIVGLAGVRHRASHLLSAGQKQRLAIAAALAMRPGCLLFDEATAMLDPAGRTQVLKTMQQLHRNGMTIIAATHEMGEAARAQRVIVLSEGRIAMEGSPRHVFSREDSMRSLQLELPRPTELALRIGARVGGFPRDVLNVGELVDAIVERLPEAPSVAPGSRRGSPA